MTSAGVKGGDAGDDGGDDFCRGVTKIFFVEKIEKNKFLKSPKMPKSGLNFGEKSSTKYFFQKFNMAPKKGQNFP